MSRGKNELMYVMREAMTEAAQRINCRVHVKQDPQDYTIATLINKAGYPIFTAYDPTDLFSFVRGVEYAKKEA